MRKKVKEKEFKKILSNRKIKKSVQCILCIYLNIYKALYIASENKRNIYYLKDIMCFYS